MLETVTLSLEKYDELKEIERDAHDMVKEYEDMKANYEAKLNEAKQVISIKYNERDKAYVVYVDDKAVEEALKQFIKDNPELKYRGKGYHMDSHLGLTLSKYDAKITLQEDNPDDDLPF